MNNKIAKLWVLFIILAVLGSVLSGMAGAANKSANLTDNATNATEEINNVTNATISNLNETVLDNASSIYNVSVNGVDSDGDGISDYDEIHGFTWENKTYFTNPYQASTDRDPYDDYEEITGIDMSTAVIDPGRHPCVPSYADLKVKLEGIEVIPKCKITSTETKEEGESWLLTTETLDWAKTDWGVETSFSIFPPFVSVKPYYESDHESYTYTLNSTSGWSREEWSVATAVDSNEAAKLKFYLKIKNEGTDAAKNLKLRFNVIIGEDKIADTVWTYVVEWRIEPGEVSDEMVIDHDREGEIVITLEELKSIECGAPISIKVTEVNAEVPWAGGWITWDDYKGEFEPVSSTIMVDFGDGDVKEYKVWSGLHKVGEPPHPYIHDISINDTIDRTLGIKEIENEVYIGWKADKEVKLENWTFGFDNETFQQINETLPENWTVYDLLNVTIKQGWVIVMKAPDIKPPEIHWASYSRDMKTIKAGVSDNENITEVIAHVKVGDGYEDVELRDEDGDLVFEATVAERIRDTDEDYIIVSDGKFTTKWEDIPRILIREDWVMFRHDARHSGYSNTTAPDTNDLLWSFETGDYVCSSPAVANGKVFVGSDDDKIYCLDEDTGELIWSYETGDDVWSSPAVADGKVFVGSYDDKIYCLDEDTGELIWSYKTGYVVFSSPAVVDGKVFVGSFDCKIYCLDEDTGELIWSYKTGGPVFSSPAVADGKVFVGSYDNKIYCLDENTGKFIWSYETGDWVSSSPVVADGKVFVGSEDDKIYCLGENTGEFIWSYKTWDWVSSSPAVADGRVFVGSCDDKIYCLNENTGELIWSYKTREFVSSSPAVADGKVFVGSEDDKIYCLNENTGELIWSYKTGNEVVLSSPAVANGKVFVGSGDNKIYCFGKVTPKTIYVDDDFVDNPAEHKWDTIQEGINDANDGDTVIVYSGLYVENVVVDKSIKLQGEDRDSTIIDGGGVGDVVKITADYVNISGFTIASATGWDKNGIYFYYTNHCSVSRNNILNNDIGIDFFYSSNNNITDNNISNSDGWGICILTSLKNNIINNNISKNRGDGIYLQSDSSNNTIANNNISRNEGNGIRAYESSNNKIINNSILNNGQGGIDISASQSWDIDNNNILNNIYGIYFSGSSNNTILNNNISFNKYDGVKFISSSYNNITNNAILYNTWNGISLPVMKGSNYSSPPSTNNTITNNNILENDHNGISLIDNRDNIIYSNNFINNTNNVRSRNSTNIWNSTEKISYVYNGKTYENYMGNYWDDYYGSDADGDGIGDTAYLIDSDKDNYPLMVPWESYFASYGVDLSCNDTQKSIPPGWTAEYTITVKNTGNWLDTINLTLSPWPIPPCGWSYWLNKANVTLSPAESAEVRLYVSAAPFHSPGDSWAVTVTGTSQGDPTKSDSITTTTTIKHPSFFDTDPSENPYPSISGTHNGTIKTNATIEVSKLYTYPCKGTGGHTEYARIWNNSGLDVNANWNGYVDDWHNISFSEPFTLVKNKTYNYTIVTGSYPQIHHTDELEVASGTGTITCDKFIDANGRVYYDWIPAIRLE